MLQGFTEELSQVPIIATKLTPIDGEDAPEADPDSWVELEVAAASVSFDPLGGVGYGNEWLSLRG
jgi:hypothetical protein